MPFPFVGDCLRTVLAVKVRFAAPFGAPLTAPGRSEDASSQEGKGWIGKVLSMAQVTHIQAEGLDAVEDGLAFSASGRFFS